MGNELVGMNVVLGAGAHLPMYATEGAACIDLMATEPCELQVGATQIISTGLRIQVPEGYCFMIFSRSGLAAKYGVIVVNAPGIIDSDYRGEVKVALHHLWTGVDAVFYVQAGDRIAQGALVPMPRIQFTHVQTLDASIRGDGGFGSTGGLLSALP